MLSKNPHLTPAQVKSILMSTADDIDAPGVDDKTGAGRVNAFKAVQAVPEGGTTSPPPSIHWYHKGDGTLYGQTTDGTTITGGAPAYNESNPAWNIVGQGDFNSDGIRDYAWWNSSTGQVSLMLMKSATEVQSRSIAYTEPDTAWRIVATGNINNDTTSDLVWRNSQTGAVYVMLINNGAVADGASIHTEPDTSWKIVAATDINGNGTTDLIWWHAITGQVADLTINGLNPATKQIIYHEPDTNWRITAAGDINNDGKGDLVWRNRITGQVYGMLINNATVAGGGIIATEPGPAWEIVSMGNYNNDNKPDLLWWNNKTGQVNLMPTDGLNAVIRTALYQESDTTWRILGEPEWLDKVYGQSSTTAHSDTGTITWENTTSGDVYGMNIQTSQVTGGGTFYTEPDRNWNIAGKGDFNGDGISDHIWYNSSTGQVYLMLMKDVIQQKSGYMIYQEANTQWQIVATGDINGDGTTDLIWWNNKTGQVYAQLISKGGVTGGSIIHTEPDTNWKIVATGDTNGNGKADLIWWNSTTGQTSIGTTNNLAALTGQIIYTEANTDWKIAGAGDMNGDNKTDLIWHNKTTGQVYGMLLSGTSIIGGGTFYGEPNTNWEIVSVGDYNNDGKADLLWHNSATGQVYQMEMNGLSVSKGTMLYQEPNTTWHIQGETEWKDRVYGVGVTTTK